MIEQLIGLYCTEEDLLLAAVFEFIYFCRVNVQGSNVSIRLDVRMCI